MSKPFDLEHLRAMSQDKKRHDPHCLEYGNCDCGVDLAEAADEIERLQIENRSLRDVLEAASPIMTDPARPSLDRVSKEDAAPVKTEPTAESCGECRFWIESDIKKLGPCRLYPTEVVKCSHEWCAEYKAGKNKP